MSTSSSLTASGSPENRFSHLEGTDLLYDMLSTSAGMEISESSGIFDSWEDHTGAPIRAVEHPPPSPAVTIVTTVADDHQWHGTHR